MRCGGPEGARRPGWWGRALGVTCDGVGQQRRGRESESTGLGLELGLRLRERAGAGAGVGPPAQPGHRRLMAWEVSMPSHPWAVRGGCASQQTVAQEGLGRPDEGPVRLSRPLAEEDGAGRASVDTHIDL